MNKPNAPTSKPISSPGSGASAIPSQPIDAEVDDSVLVAETLAGKAEAFEKLFVKYRQRVFATAWRLLRDEDAALDVLQDAYIRAYEQLESLKGEWRFFPWLRRIAVNLALDRLRHARRGVEVSLNEKWGPDSEEGEDRGAALKDDDEQKNPARSAEVTEFSRAMSEALLKLSDTHRAVFMLHAAEGMSYKEIAEALGCNIGTVMSRLFYARKRLQELLEPHLKEV